MNAARFINSATVKSDGDITGYEKFMLTLFHLMARLRRTLEVRHWSIIDDVRKRGRLEVLLPRLFIGVALT